MKRNATSRNTKASQPQKPDTRDDDATQPSTNETGDPTGSYIEAAEKRTGRRWRYRLRDSEDLTRMLAAILEMSPDDVAAQLRLPEVITKYVLPTRSLHHVIEDLNARLGFLEALVNREPAALDAVNTWFESPSKPGRRPTKVGNEPRHVDWYRKRYRDKLSPTKIVLDYNKHAKKEVWIETVKSTNSRTTTKLLRLLDLERRVSTSGLSLKEFFERFSWLTSPPLGFSIADLDWLVRHLRLIQKQRDQRRKRNP